MAFTLPCVYNYIRKLSWKEAKVIQNHEIANFRNTGQGKTRYGKEAYIQAYDSSSN
jgi:hypothetical protein